MRLKERFVQVLATLETQFGHMDTELHYETPFQLLIATVLSAQCTDKRVNMVTQTLFADYPTPQAMAQASVEEIFEHIRSVSYPNSKAKYLQGIARMVHEEFADAVPQTTEELTRLPGVGRKTAHVVEAFAFGKSALAVDTHVFRVSHRIGLVSERCTTPLSVERALVRHIPAEQVALAHSWLLLHGRYTCKARRPACNLCEIAAFCKTHELDARFDKRG